MLACPVSFDTILAVALGVFIPGPALILSMSTTMQHGKKAGVMAGCGLALGFGIWAILSLFGVHKIFELHHNIKVLFDIFAICLFSYLAYGMFTNKNFDFELKKQEGETKTMRAFFSKGFFSAMFDAIAPMFFGACFAVLSSRCNNNFAYEAFHALAYITINSVWNIAIVVFFMTWIKKFIKQFMQILNYIFGSFMAFFVAKMLLNILF